MRARQPIRPSCARNINVKRRIRRKLHTAAGDPHAVSAHLNTGKIPLRLMLYRNDYIMERCENGTVYDAVLCTQSILRMQFLCQCSRITLHAQIHQQIHLRTVVLFQHLPHIVRICFRATEQDRSFKPLHYHQRRVGRTACKLHAHNAAIRRRVCQA